jgi:transposase
MKIKHVVGIDVSKLTLDYHHHGSSLKSQTISNDEKGYRSLLRGLKKEVSKDVDNIMIVMEHTGYYSYSLEQFLYKHKINYTKKPALDIKRSCGMIRGKSDKADAKMISRYGWMRREELKVSKPVSGSQIELQQLMAHRDKLVADKASYQSRIKELQGQLKDKLSALVLQSSNNMLHALSIESKKIEQQIEQAIKQDPDVLSNYELIKTVRGIGFATAVHFIIATENFTRFENHRKFACYCGVAPFENSSGTSVRGKTKVSSLANRKIKSLLTMAAISAIQHDVDLKEKYQQKVAEGKPKMCA